jgi:aromatic ring-opening dioxygenase LigB subunit
MAEGAPARDSIATAHRLADAVGRLWGEVGLVCSAHTSAALSPAAPLTEKPEGRALDTTILEVLNTDCGLLADLPPDLWDAGGSCGAGPLTCFGALFGGTTATVACYEYPFGVGYLVATATP